MKGGVTSGVVYPLAVCELAKVYSFKNIAGTSAGAIAAAATGAAECGRRSGSSEAKSFEGLATLPGWIGKPGRLLKMFHPDDKTRDLFGLVMAALNSKKPIGRFASIVGELLIRFPVTVAIIAMIVWAIRRWLLADLIGVTFAYAYGATILLGLLLFLVIIALYLYRQINRTVPANFYGMSRAYDASKGDGKADDPLTNWLTHYLNELAGKPFSKGPLTFGDLYNAPAAPGEPGGEGAENRAVNLEMMTTALNHGRPYRLPFRDPDRRFYFSAQEFAQLFPPAIVNHMISHAPGNVGPGPHASGCGPLHAFPAPDDLPVVVATRMSLSFPVLLSAVPLYAVDYTLTENQDKTRPPRAERCWFSDGGLSSNMPIHFFDTPLPLWPTFAINLKQFHPDHDREADAVWLPESVGAGMQILWTRFEEAGRFGSLPDFLWSIVNTMQNWQDTTQSLVPGYRDRMPPVSG